MAQSAEREPDHTALVYRSPPQPVASATTKSVR
jgi:hypothetical protein